MTAGSEDLVAAAKRLLRKAVLLRRDARPAERRRADDLARTAVLQSRFPAGPPPVVAAYMSAGAEPSTLPLVAWLAAAGRRVLLPVLSRPDGSRRDEPAWAAYEGPDALRMGPAGIVEPTGPVVSATALAEADLVLCPGLAGSEAGERLGRGGGWYDRVLGLAQAPVWLLLNDDEVLPALPTHPWDHPVDALVTPSRLLPCGTR